MQTLTSTLFKVVLQKLETYLKELCRNISRGYLWIVEFSIIFLFFKESIIFGFLYNGYILYFANNTSLYFLNLHFYNNFLIIMHIFISQTNLLKGQGLKFCISHKETGIREGSLGFSTKWYPTELLWIAVTPSLDRQWCLYSSVPQVFSPVCFMKQ